MASRLLWFSDMDKSQDADLEKGYETIEDVSVFFDDEARTPLFTDDEDLFDTLGYDENDEFDYEPEGAFLD